MKRQAGAAVLLICALSPVWVAIASAAQDTESSTPAGDTWRVQLLAPLSTRFNRKGDIVSARVLSPPTYQDGILEGEIRDLKPGAGAGKGATIHFDFHTLHRNKEAIPVAIALIEALNSRRQTGVDEDGSELESPGHGSGKRSSSRVASGSGRLTVKAANLSLAPGSEFVLQVQVKKSH